MKEVRINNPDVGSRFWCALQPHRNPTQTENQNLLELISEVRRTSAVKFTAPLKTLKGVKNLKIENDYRINA